MSDHSIQASRDICNLLSNDSANNDVRIKIKTRMQKSKKEVKLGKY